MLREPFELMPHWTARGEPDRLTAVDGADHLCRTVSSRERCVTGNLPFGRFACQRSRHVPGGWLGTVVEDKRDAAGTLYRRNRVYDPATGRFTQEDPIGLAGGLNL